MTLRGGFEKFIARFIKRYIEPDTGYKQSFLPLSLKAYRELILPGVFAFAGVFVASVMLPLKIWFIFVLAILFCIIYEEVSYIRYVRRPTKFESECTAIKKFRVKEKSHPFSLGRLIVFKEGLGIRVNSRSYFIFYSKISSISREKRLLGNELRIEINEESLPQQFIIISSELDNIESIIHEMTANIRSERDETLSGTAGRGCISEDASKSQEKGIYYSKKVIIGILLLELLVMLSTGPAVILCKQLAFKPTQFDRLYTRNEYRPSRSGAPKDYVLVEVIYNGKGEVANETYYLLNGVMTDSEGYPILQAIFGTLAIVFFSGMLFIVIASREKDTSRKQTLSLYGAMTCLGMIPVLIIWIGLINWIITPLYFGFS